MIFSAEMLSAMNSVSNCHRCWGIMISPEFFFCGFSIFKYLKHDFSTYWDTICITCSLLKVSIDRACSVTALMPMRLEAQMSLSCNLLGRREIVQCRIFHRDATDSGKIAVDLKLHSWIADCYALDPPLHSTMLFLFA